MWIGIYDPKLIQEDMILSCMDGKHVKTSPHMYEELQNFSYLCYLDSKLDEVNERFVENFIKNYFIEQNYALLLREHWFLKPNVWDEYNESLQHHERYRRESEKYKDYIETQLKNGLNEVTMYHGACGLLIRNMKHKKIKELNNTWYQHIQECGIQDQISFFFVKQLFPECIYAFKENPFV